MLNAGNSVAEHLPRMEKALDSILSTKTKQKQNTQCH
jgi:hypothetical protein